MEYIYLLREREFIRTNDEIYNLYSINTTLYYDYKVVDPSGLALYMPFDYDTYDYSNKGLVTTSNITNTGLSINNTNMVYGQGCLSLSRANSPYVTLPIYYINNILNGTFSVWVFITSYDNYNIISKQSDA